MLFRSGSPHLEIALKHVRTDLQDADFLTKPMVSHKFMANRNRLMHFLSLLSLLAVLAGGEHFEPATPLIWIPTNYYVDTGITEYEIDFTPMNPCQKLQAQFWNPPVAQTQATGQTQQAAQGQVKLVQGGQQTQQVQTVQGQNGLVQITHVVPVAPPNNLGQPIQLDTDAVVAKHIIDECNMMYNQVYVTKLSELLSRQPHHRKINDKIKKRHSLLSDAAETTAELICGGCVSNLISTIFSRLYPNSDHNKINRNEAIIKQHEENIREFNDKFNVTYELQRNILETMIAFSRSEREQNRQILHIAALMPRVSWTSSFMMTRITAAAADLKTIIDEYTYGRVAVKEMIDMLNLTDIRGKQDKHTGVRVCTHKRKKIPHRINTGQHQLILLAEKQTKLVVFRQILHRTLTIFGKILHQCPVRDESYKGWPKITRYEVVSGVVEINGLHIRNHRGPPCILNQSLEPKEPL